MKPILVLLLFITNLTLGQKLPKLSLAPIGSKQLIKAPTDLGKGDICVTIVLGGGMDAYNYYYHYIFSGDGTIKAFMEEIPEPYLKKLKATKTKLELDEPAKVKLWENLNSKTTVGFTSLSQKDFFKPAKAKPAIQPPCVTDAAGYSISFIQDNKQKVFNFYAPQYYLSGKCKNETINIKNLQKFVDLLELWRAGITQ